MAAPTPPYIATLPSELKFLSPYLQRASELEQREPVISYYCKYFCAKQALERGPKGDKAVQTYLLGLMDDLEKIKASLVASGAEGVSNDVVGAALVENFAMKIFVKADNEDRAGKATKNTARTFLAASVFLEIMKVFGELEPEVEDKIKYAKWKAADILKAIKEGRQPTAGPAAVNSDLAGENVGGEGNMSEGMGHGGSDPLSPAFASAQHVDGTSGSSSMAHTPTMYPAVPGHAAGTHAHPLPPITTTPHGDPAHASAPPPGSASSVPSGLMPSISFPQLPSVPPSDALSPSKTPMTAHLPNSEYAPEVDIKDILQFDPQIIQSAQKYARFAISALQYDDIATAVSNLEQALGLLEQYRNKI